MESSEQFDKEFASNLNGFDLTFILSDTRLSINAELKSGKLFSGAVENHEVASLTKELFTDLESLCQGLLYGIEKKEKDITVEISPEGELRYTYSTIFIDKLKQFKFVVKLNEVLLDPLLVIERRMGKLARKVEMQEERIKELEKENKKLKQGFVSDEFMGLVLEKCRQYNEEFEKRFLDKFSKNEEKKVPMSQNERKEDQVDKKEHSKIIPEISNNVLTKFEFNSGCPDSDHVLFRNNKKTIINKSYKWTNTFCIPSLSKGTASASFKVEKSANNTIMIGIVPKSLLKISDQVCHFQKGTYFYYGSSGGIHCIPTNKSVKYGVGSVITVTLNKDNQWIEWRNNGDLVHYLDFDANEEEYSFCVELCDISDSVSIVSS